MSYYTLCMYVHIKREREGEIYVRKEYSYKRSLLMLGIYVLYTCGNNIKFFVSFTNMRTGSYITCGRFEMVLSLLLLFIRTNKVRCTL